MFLLLELVTDVFLGFANFQTFLDKMEARTRIWPCQDSQQRADMDCEFSKKIVARMKEYILFPNKDFAPNQLVNKCINEKTLRREKGKESSLFIREKQLAAE
jgi:hypothetical protein